MALLLGGVSYPLAAQATGASLLPVADPWLAKALPFWQACLNAYLGSALAAALPGQIHDAARPACATALPIDPLPWLGAQPLRPPLLACYPADGEFARRTMEHDQITGGYKVVYVLPPLDFVLMQRVAPILQAAFGLLMRVTEEQHDPAYASDAEVWAPSGAVSVTFGKAVYGLFGEEDAQTRMPMFQADVSVVIRDEFAPDQGAALEYMLAQTGAGTNEEGILPDAIAVRTDVVST